MFSAFGCKISLFCIIFAEKYKVMASYVLRVNEQIIAETLTDEEMELVEKSMKSGHGSLEELEEILK